MRNGRMLAALLTLAVLMALPAVSMAGGKYSVHLASYRTERSAGAGWRKLARNYPDILQGLEHYIVQAEVPGKGMYYRVFAGNFSDHSRALELQHKLQSRGTYANVMPLGMKPVVAVKAPMVAPPKAASAPVVRSVPTAAKAPAPPALPKVVLSPHPTTKPVVKKASVAAPVSPSGKESTVSKLESMVHKALRKFVPTPKPSVRHGDKSPVNPLAREAVRENLAASPPPSSLSASSTAPHASFRDNGFRENGVTLARPRNKSGRIAAVYGNMSRDFDRVPPMAPLPHLEEEKRFKPYVGLGMSF